MTDPGYYLKRTPHTGGTETVFRSSDNKTLGYVFDSKDGFWSAQAWRATHATKHATKELAAESLVEKEDTMDGTTVNLKFVNRDSHIWLACGHDGCDWQERLMFPSGFATGTGNTFETGNGQIVAHGLYHLDTQHGGIDQDAQPNCGQPWVAELMPCPRCGKWAAAHANVNDRPRQS